MSVRKLKRKDQTIIYISRTNIFFENLKKNLLPLPKTKLGSKFNYDILNSIVSSRLQNETKKGFILDGYPRTLKQ